MVSHLALAQKGAQLVDRLGVSQPVRDLRGLEEAVGQVLARAEEAAVFVREQKNGVVR